MKPTISECGNGHGWLPQYRTSPTTMPTSSCDLPDHRLLERLARLDEAGEEREERRRERRVAAQQDAAVVVGDQRDDRRGQAREGHELAAGQRRARSPAIGSVAARALAAEPVWSGPSRRAAPPDRRWST